MIRIATICVFFLPVATASASVLIDTFNDVQNLSLTTATTVSDGLTPAPNAIGNARVLSLTVETANAPQAATVGVNGSLNYTNGAGVNSFLDITWDASTDTSINQSGIIPAINLLSGGNTGIRLYYASTASVSYNLRIWGGGGLVQWLGSMPGTGGATSALSLPFASAAVFGTPDLSQTGAVNLFLNPGTAVNLRLDQFEATNLSIPEPSTTTLFLVAIIAWSLRSRQP